MMPVGELLNHFTLGLGAHVDRHRIKLCRRNQATLKN